MSSNVQKDLVGERADLLATLASHRYFLRFTVRDLSDEQVRQRSTVSELTLAGLLKHVADVESSWVDFILRGADAGTAAGAKDSAAGDKAEEWSARFRVGAGTSVTTLLERYEQVALRTDSVVATLPDLDASHPLPDEPWFEAGATWTARRVLLHIIAETAQHAGHADIIRESIDGAKTMG
ncbi:MAG: DinB family protein [Acidimicrobiales bacterium]|jgi:uncharacterized damage-inducible protein DinB